MKKYGKILITTLLTFSIALTGCSLGAKDEKPAEEFLTDKENSEDEGENIASNEDETIIIQDLFEPVIEESEKLEDSLIAEQQEPQDETQEPVEIVFFGDSQIANGRDDGSDIATILQWRVPNSKVYNLGLGGTTAAVEASTTNVDAGEIRSISFYGMSLCYAGEADRNAALGDYPGVLETMNSIDPSTVDYIIVEYGANDFINGSPLDCDMYATTGEKAHAFYNALCSGFDALRRVSPNATIILMSPFYGIYVDANGAYIGDSYVVSNGIGTLADYAKKAGNAATDSNVIFFDGMFMSKCDLYLDTAGDYLLDNLHLNLLGRQIFARLLSHYINYQEDNEPYAYLEQDFIKIAEFDPNEYYRCSEDIMREYYPESWEKYIRGEFPLAQPSEEALEKYASDITDG